MPKRPTTVVASACLATVTALLLTACGSGSDSKDEDKIAGADTASRSASPSASPSDDGIDRPKVELPSDVKNVFEGGPSGDATKDAVLADNERNLEVIDAAITGDVKSAEPALKFYNKGSALISAASYIQSFYDDGRSFIGTTRYYDRQVTLVKDGAATLTYCQDSTKTYPKDRKTKKVDRSISASADDYAFFSERLEKNAKGVWQSVNVTSGPGAKKCM